MATLLDATKAPNSAKVEEFVNRQLKAARRRVRVLDFFAAGLVVAIASLIFLLIVQFIDRAYETPPKIGYLVWGIYGALAVGYLYWSVFRPSRREINPYYAARELELNVDTAKNSLVTWVDLEDDQKLPPSIRAAIGQKAAKDLKGLDLNQAIENKTLLWVGIAAGVLLIGNAIVAFLPPTRTALTLEEPANGNVTVFNNQDVKFQVRVRGRIPQPNSAESVRLRLWYNPEDPETFEERLLTVSETDKRQFELTIPPRQVRMGFRYRILAGNTQTPEYTVTCKIIPEFTGFDVSYEYPTYLKRPAEQNNDPNLLAPYASTATLIVHTNRDVKNGHIEIDGQARTIDGQLIEGQTDSIKFAIPFEKESQYRVWFTTTEGDRNSDPKRFRLAVIDPKPVFRTFDISYEYPAYLRWKPATGTDIREPEIEAIRGSVVTLTAKTNRGVKSAQLQLEGLPPIIGTSVPDEPMWVRFKLPPIDKDGTAKVSFAPGTPENPTLPKAIPVRAIIDQPPTVQLEIPKTDEITLPANGTLELKGFATDDHGIDGMTLQMKLVGAGDLSLDGKPYRNGISFLRKEDNSWPIRVDYKDFVKLPDIRMPNNPNFRIAQGSTVEFWVEARDNCTVPPGPNVGRSNAKRFKVIAPVQAPAEKAKVENRNQELNKEQKNHNEKQDKQLQGEQRPQNQPRVKGQNPPEPKNDGNPQDNPMPMGGQPQGDPMPKNGNPMPKDGDPMRGGMNPDNTGNNPMPMPKEGMNPDPNQDQQNQDIERAAKESENAKKEGKQKPDSRPDPNAKVEPSEQRPAPKNDPNGEPPADQKPMPKNDPNQNIGENGPAGEKRDGKVDKTKEDKSENKPGGDKPMDMTGEPNGQDNPRYGERKPGDDGEQKPDRKQPAGKEPPPEKGGARPEQSPEQKGMNPDQKPQAGANKPEKEVTQGEEKQPAPKEGMGGTGEKDQPDQTVGKDKPKERPGAGEGRPQSKKSGPMEETAGEKRPQPKGGGPEAGENRPEPKHDMGDETAKSEGKPQPGQGQPNGEKNELDRETAGELDREINSPKPEISDKGKSDVERLMRNKETRQKTRDELDKLEKNAKDQLSRKKAQDLKKAGEEAAKNYDQEKPTEEKVDELAKKLNSKDKQEREEAEQRLKDWQKDQQTKKDLEKEVDQLKKKKPEEGKKVEQAMNKPNPKKDGEPGQSGDTPKPDEQKLNEMAKDLQSNDPMKREQAQKQLEQMMNDPKTRDQAKDKLNDMAKNANNQDDKKNLENAAQKANDMAKANGQKQEKDLKDIADKMAGKNEQDKKDAENKLNEMMKDPAKAEEAKKQLQDMANNSKNPDDKKKLEDAAKKADDMAKANGQKQEQDLKDIADKMAGKDEQAKKEAENKLNEMMKDPAKAEAAKKKMEEMAKNAKNADDKKNMEDAAKKADDMAKANGNKPEPKTDPKDLKEMADKLAGKEGEAKKKEAEDKLKDMMKDPAKAEEAKKKMEEMAKNASKDDEKKALEEMLKQANEMAKNPPKTDPKDLKDLMDKMNKTDPKEREEAKEKLKEAMKDPKIREQMEKLKEQMAKNQEDPAKQKEFADIMKELGGGNPEDNGKPDPADPRNKLKAAELMLDKFKKNLTDDEFNQSLKWTEDQKAEWIRKQEATIAELKKQAEKGDWNTNRMVRPTTDKGPSSVKFDPKSGVDPLRGGRYAPPAGYADPYKKFTEEASGVKASVPTK